MRAYLLSGLCGLLAGMMLHWTGLDRPSGMRQALGLRRSVQLRSALYALGALCVLTAFWCYLAVIDVDSIEVLPLSAATAAGGLLMGAAVGLSGFTPVTAFAGLGGGAAVEALCTLLGALAVTQLLPLLQGMLQRWQGMVWSDTTLFRMTLDEPYLLGGGFLGQACAGLLLAVVAACIPSPRPERPLEIAEEAAAAPPVPQDGEGAVPHPPEDAEEAAPEPLSATGEDDEAPPDSAPQADPDDAPEETFVALLEGEEPLVVDTGLDGGGDPDSN